MKRQSGPVKFFYISLLFLAAVAAALFFGAPQAGPGRGRAVSAAYYIGDEPLYAQALCLYDASAARMLCRSGAEERRAPASLVKLLTALTAMDYCDMEDTVRVGGEVRLIARDASRAWLYEGDILSVRQLLIAMLLPSGNDAAYALAAFCGARLAAAQGYDAADHRQSIALFLQAMNEKAALLGAVDSHFVNPDGYDDAEQYSTACDLALIAAAFCAEPRLCAIAALPRSRELWANGREAVYYNTNELLREDSAEYYAAATGLKTGTSSQAGACIIASFERNGSLYIAVVLGSSEENRFRDCRLLMDSVQ